MIEATTEGVTMTRTHTSAPDLMPHLAAGRHRSPRHGACFMEYASFLAGEAWSDHPECTDPVLAALARSVNDVVDDAHRDGLLQDVPRVIGLRGDDVLRLSIALRAIAAALPIASLERQRSLAVAARATLQALALRGVTESPAIAATHEALAEAPHAARWARDFLATSGLGATRLVTTGSMLVIRTAVLGIAEACVPDPDDRLVELLRTAIRDCETDRTAPVVRVAYAPIPALA